MSWSVDYFCWHAIPQGNTTDKKDPQW